MSMEVERLLHTPQGEVWAGWVARPFELLSPFGGEEFALLLHVASDDIRPDEQAALSDAIVAQGCRHATCAGHDASSWDDAIDCAFVETDPDYDPPDEDFVMTNWREDEALQEVAWSFLWASAYEGFVPKRFLALVVGGGVQDLHALAAAVRAAAEDGSQG